MQPNTITLAVDEANDATTVDHVFTRYEEYLNRSVYIDEDHTVASRNTMGLYRTFPKVNGNFRGVSKTAIKFSRDISVNGVDSETTLVAPIIIELGVSLPVGVTSADVLKARQTMIAILDYDDIMDPLMEQLMV